MKAIYIIEVDENDIKDFELHLDKRWIQYSKIISHSNFIENKIRLNIIYNLIQDSCDYNLLNNTRKTEFVQNRQIGMYLMRKFTTASLTEIALKYNKNHATAIHSIKQCEKFIEVEKQFERKVANFVMILNNYFKVR